jgi:hypothetical protein
MFDVSVILFGKERVWQEKGNVFMHFGEGFQLRVEGRWEDKEVYHTVLILKTPQGIGLNVSC